MLIALFWISLAVFLASYVLMQRLVASRSGHDAQKMCAYIAGCSGWMALIGMTIEIGKAVFFVLEYFTGRLTGDDMPAAMALLVGGGMLVGLIVLFLDMVPAFDFRKFILNSLFFRSYEIRQESLEVEQEKQRVHTIYKDLTGEAIPEHLILTGPRKVTGTEERRAELNARETLRLDILHREEELSKLAAGDEVDIMETWTANRYKRCTHPFYADVIEARITPNISQFRLGLAFARVDAGRIEDSEFRRKLQNQLYGFLQAVNDEPWLAPYRKWYDGITLSCSREHDNLFSDRGRVEFFRLRVVTAELDGLRSGASRRDPLATIASVEWIDTGDGNHGSMISEDS